MESFDVHDSCKEDFVHHHIYDLVEDTDLLGSGHAQLHPYLFDFTSWRPVVFIFFTIGQQVVTMCASQDTLHQ